MTKTSLVTVLILVSAIAITAQSSAPSYLSELSFNESSSKDTTAALGKPSKIDAGEIHKQVASGTEKLKTSIFRYRNLRGWNRVDLTFHEDRLIEIQYWPKNKTMRASTLPNSLAADFVSVAGFSEKVPIATFEGQKDPQVPKVYGPIYFMVTVRPSFSLVALINNGSLKAIFKEAARAPTIEMYPGFVENIRTTSRSIESSK